MESFVTYVRSDWATQDSQSSPVLDVLFYISHVFRMQAFFLMAGFFAHLLYHRRGARAFARNRLQRLLGPFLLFWPLLYGVNRQLWVWGAQRVAPLSHAEAVARLPAFMRWETGFPLMHLWFLYFLLWFCVLVLVLRPLAEWWPIPAQRLRQWLDRGLALSLRSRWGGLVLGAALVGPMLGMTDWFGVDTSASGLLPRPAPFVVYGLYFALGWLLHRQPHLLGAIGRLRRPHLLLAAALIGLLLAINLLGAEPSDPAAARRVLAGLNALYAFASMTAVLTFLGYCLVYFAAPSPRMRYLADAAYWGYLVHFPLVVCCQILVAPYAWPWLVKLGLILGPSTVILGLSYHYGVRNTWLGVLLNGRRAGS